MRVTMERQRSFCRTEWFSMFPRVSDVSIICLKTSKPWMTVGEAGNRFLEEKVLRAFGVKSYSQVLFWILYIILLTSCIICGRGLELRLDQQHSSRNSPRQIHSIVPDLVGFMRPSGLGRDGSCLQEGGEASRSQSERPSGNRRGAVRTRCGPGADGRGAVRLPSVAFFQGGFLFSRLKVFLLLCDRETPPRQIEPRRTLVHADPDLVRVAATGSLIWTSMLVRRGRARVLATPQARP